MDTQEILDRKERIVGEFGPWTAHNIHLGGGIYTVDRSVAGQEVMLRRVLQIIQDVAHHPLRELRVLDLACLEGLYGIELALQGATVVGLEARQASIEKARAVKEILGLTGIELIQDDVRHISVQKYGRFDVVLCAGILYHLDAPDVFGFLEQIFEMSTDFAVFDTHVSIAAKEERIHKNRKYFGCSYVEHDSDSSIDERTKRLWASVDNINSFWFTKPSLLNFLSHTGFTSVYECHNPSAINDWLDRVTLVALKGTRKALLSSEVSNSSVADDWPENSGRQLYPTQRSPLRQSVNTISGSILRPAKGLLKRLVGA